MLPLKATHLADKEGLKHGVIVVASRKSIPPSVYPFCPLPFSRGGGRPGPTVQYSLFACVRTCAFSYCFLGPPLICRPTHAHGNSFVGMHATLKEQQYVLFSLYLLGNAFGAKRVLFRGWPKFSRFRTASSCLFLLQLPVCIVHRAVLKAFEMFTFPFLCFYAMGLLGHSVAVWQQQYTTTSLLVASVFVEGSFFRLCCS